MNAAGAGGVAAIAVAVQIALVGVGAPLLGGLMRKVRCRMEGRAGPPLRQPLRELRKLVRRERLRPEHTSWVYGAAPLVLVATSVVVAGVAPIVTTRSPLAGGADLFAIVYLLLLGSLFLGLAGLDSGTAFGGMGASRALTLGALAEPALLVAILALAVPAHSSSLPVIIHGTLRHPGWAIGPARVLALAAFVVVVLAESGRLPFDNPSTHLELTMIHEAMVLEYAGPDLALVTASEQIRTAVLLGLLMTVFVPWGVATSSAPLAFVWGAITLTAKVAGAGVALAAFEVVTAKLRLFRLPELLAAAFVAATLSVLVALVTA
ncbi:MAG TPA: NADH-quinone oxidoreductase subunit H [Verrucomicrobiae bacterium]|nr:NADH-quinone oxidoreductase subunit H [Verrucomicrobiae bacterium]